MLRFHTSVEIHLSLEDYYNAGLSSKRAKEIIEGIDNGDGWGGKLWCTPGGINGNWTVHGAASERDVGNVVWKIGQALDLEMFGLKVKQIVDETYEGDEGGDV